MVVSVTRAKEASPMKMSSPVRVTPMITAIRVRIYTSSEVTSTELYLRVAHERLATTVAPIIKAFIARMVSILLSHAVTHVLREVRSSSCLPWCRRRDQHRPSPVAHEFAADATEQQSREQPVTLTGGRDQVGVDLLSSDEKLRCRITFAGNESHID